VSVHPAPISAALRVTVKRELDSTRVPLGPLLFINSRLFSGNVIQSPSIAGHETTNGAETELFGAQMMVIAPSTFSAEVAIPRAASAVTIFAESPLMAHIFD
jgi:hypothetical protein